MKGKTRRGKKEITNMTVKKKKEERKERETSDPQAKDPGISTHECTCSLTDVHQAASCYNLDRQRQPINRVIPLRGSSV